MLSTRTKELLRWHAGLQDLPRQASRSIAFCTWPANQSTSELSAAIEDYLQTLATVNQELRESEYLVGDERCVPLVAAYSVAEVGRMLREVAKRMEESLELKELTRPDLASRSLVDRNSRRRSP